MKRSIIIFSAMAVLAFVLWKCSTATHSAAIGGLPQNVCKSCTVSLDTFKTWFVGGQVNADSIVTPANSVAFPHRNNCDFYVWSERMFLWLTSPIKNRFILTDTGFYNVSPPDSAGNRHFIQHKPGSPVMMASHLLKVGPDRLPILKADNGKIFEIERSTANVKDVVKDESGKTVEVDHIKAETNNTFSFIDKAGKTIAHPHPIIKEKGPHLPIVHMYIVNKKPVYLDASGNVVASEEGQATGDALMAQTKSLVYYLVLVNDVYVQYLNLANSNPAFRKKFPTTPGDRHAIVTYAKQHGYNLPDSSALAMEIKSSWVETTNLPDSNNYIIMSAVIPTYTVNSDSTKWTPTGSKIARVALVGMHVVGSAAGHPEMIWATFEHNINTPNAAYSYLDSTKKVVNVPQEGGSGWLFTNNSTDTGSQVNQSHISTNDPKINNGPNTDTLFAQPGHTISPSNTQRSMPWGSAAGTATNPEDKSSAASNSEIISINNSILGMLAAGDVRKNYLLIGATWTANGSAPSGNSYSGVDTPGVSIGTSVLSNSTMETYIQFNNTSCFTCHSNNPGPGTLSPDTLSHIFTPLINGIGITAPKLTSPKKK